MIGKLKLFSWLLMTSLSFHVWLSSKNFLYRDANFFCYANFSIVFGPKFMGEQSLSGEGANFFPPLWRKARCLITNQYDVKRKFFDPLSNFSAEWLMVKMT